VTWVIGSPDDESATDQNYVTASGPFDRPILAFGMPRSGTTWLGKIFDSHPATLYRHEPDTWRRIGELPLFAAASPTAAERATLRAFVADMPGMLADRVCGKRPLFPKAYASPLAVRIYAARSLLYKGLGRLGIESQLPLPPQPPAHAQYRLAMKSIESLGRVGAFAESVPEGRFVHIVRHPCGYVASVLRGEQQRRFGHNEAASDFELYRMACETPQAARNGLTLEGIRAMTSAERLAWRWVVYNEKASEELDGRPNALTLYYEQLCAAPLEIARELFRFAELDWHPQSEEFVQTSTADSRADYYSVFKDPLESAWRWRSELGRDDAERVLSIVARSPVARPYLEPRDWNRAA
jgi:hypothetical protein